MPKPKPSVTRPKAMFTDGRETHRDLASALVALEQVADGLASYYEDDDGYIGIVSRRTCVVHWFKVQPDGSLKLTGLTSTPLGAPMRTLTIPR